jgi:hypothetical protein
VTDGNLRADTARVVRVRWVYEELEPVPAEWTLMLADLMNNLRSALDLAIWQLSVERVGGEDHLQHARSVTFPVCATTKDFERMPVRRALMSLPKAARDVVEWLQPYNRDGPAERDPLMLLHQLNRLDKHRELHVSIRSAQAFVVTFQRDPPDLTLQTAARDVLLEHGTFLASATFPRPPFAVEIDLNRTIVHREMVRATSSTPMVDLVPTATEMFQVCVSAVALLDDVGRSQQAGQAGLRG